MTKTIRALLLLAALLPAAVFGQSSPGFIRGQVPSADQWNGYFSGKLDYSSSAVIGLWSGTCNSSTFMRGDGACASAFTAPLSVGQGGTGGTTAIAGARALSVPYILGKSAIPFIGLSSGSVASNGAISGITALGTTYAQAYCYFPANILAASIAAGWYYCTFSSTTAGVAYLNTYTSGTPTIPGSPTAVTAGQGSFTGDTGEEFGPTISVPAGTIGNNGKLRIKTFLRPPSSGNNQYVSIRYSGNAGTLFLNGSNMSGVNRYLAELDITNRGAANSQVSNGLVSATSSASAVGLQYGAVDTTVTTSLVISIQRAVATENVVIEDFDIELLSDGS